MNDLTVLTSSSALAAFEEFAADEGSGNVQYMKFTKTGEFLYGQEENVIGNEEQWVAKMDTLSRGYICWVDGQCAGEEMARVISGHQVSRQDLEDFGPYSAGDGWREQSTIEFQSLDTGDVVLFKTSSKGGLSALGTLAKEFAAHCKSGTDYLAPVVSMERSSYKHKSYGTIFTPKFEVVDWANAEGYLLSEGVDVEPEEEVEEVEVIPAKKPAPRKPRAAAPRRNARPSV